MSRRFERTLGLLTAAAFAAVPGCMGEPEDLDETEAIAAADQGALTIVSTSFQNGAFPAATYAGATDTTLQESAPTTVDGSGAFLRVDADYPSASRKATNALARFDLGAIPPGSTVSAVTLTVNVTNSTSGSGYALYPLRRAWSGAQATWQTAQSGTAWASGGARGATDRSSTAIGALNPTATGPASVTFNAAGVAAVQSWIANPTSNFGFVVDSLDNADGLVFDASNAGTAANRPRLAVTFQPPASGTGLKGDYFVGTAFEKLVASRTDAKVDFDWGTSAPQAGVPADGFSVRWTGQVLARYTQPYTFFTTSDDGVRVWVDGVPVIDNWTNHAPVENSGVASLTAGKKHEIKVEYFERAGGSVAKLSWSSPSQAKEIIPASQLFPAVTTPPATGFAHPGILSSRAQLDFVKAKTAAGQEPWKGKLAKAASSRYGQLGWVPKPVTKMQCGNGGSTLDIGCTDSREDALAAYTDALLWYHTGDRRYADTAIKILNAYSSTLQQIVYTSGDNSTYNGPLQAAWLSELFPRSAEILRYSNSGWAAADAQRFGQMLTNAMLPRIVAGWYGGGSNWNNSMASGVINIAVYNDDRALFDKGLALFRVHVPETLYLTSDGPFPIPPPEHRNADGTWKAGVLESQWYSQSEFGTARVNGLVKETCRDFGHTQMSLASIAQAAETALIQGVDLYTEQQARIIASYEFIAKYQNRYAAPNNVNKTVAVEPWLCDGSIEVQDLPTWEVAYNHYVNRKGLAMPETATTVKRTRLYGSYTNLQMSWETLTHAFGPVP